jgi:hypothetical protein
VTESDFENYVKTNFSNLIHDVKVVNNWAYLTGYLKYFYDLGISNPNNVSNEQDIFNNNNKCALSLSKKVPTKLNKIITKREEISKSL